MIHHVFSPKRKYSKRAFKKIAERIKKRYQRGQGPKLIAIKSLECNFNPVKRTYNPHFHILVPSKELAELLLQEWLSSWTGKYALRKAKNLRQVDDRARDLIEVVKYGSKILTEPNPNSKTNKKRISRRVYIAALYNILRAMRGLHNKNIEEFSSEFCGSLEFAAIPMDRVTIIEIYK